MKSTASTRVQRTYLDNYRPPPVAVPNVSLTFELDETKTVVHSKLTVIQSDTADSQDVFLNGEKLQLLSVRIDGQKLPEDAYELDAKGIALRNAPKRFDLEISNIINPSENLALSGMYLSDDIICTQCEAEGFRNITYFPDRPDVLSRYSVTIEASRRKFPVLLSNGELQSTEELNLDKHCVTWVDPHPKPCYLFALVAGPLNVLEDEFTTESGKSVALRFYTSDHDLDKCAHAMDCLKRAMRWDEEQYGREYDLDNYMIVAVDHFNMGAMENKGLNIFNSKYVYAQPDTATDQDFRAVESVISHEYFHNWSGNRVTLRDWFQLSLKEGFTIYRDQQFSSDMRSAEVQRIYDVNMVKLHQFREDAGPSKHPVQPDSYLTIDNFYTITVYNKGAELIRMMQLLLGVHAFRAGCDLYFDRFDGCAATVEDFVICMEQVSGASLQQFRLWYKTPGTPEVTVERHYDSAEKTFTLTLEQSPMCADNDKRCRPMHIPIRTALLDAKGSLLPLKLTRDDDASVTELIVELTKQRQSFSFFDVRESPTPSILRGFSAPVIIKDKRADEDLHFLMARDNDGYSRWNACQQVFKNQINELISELRHARAAVIPDEFFASFGAILSDISIADEFKALLLETPSEISIAQTMEVIDTAAVHDARQSFMQQAAARFAEEFKDMFARLSGDANHVSAAAGRRRLKNLCLNYLISLDTAEVHSLAHRHFDSADNMTDRAAALGAIVDSSSSSRQAALDSFYRSWCHDPSVIDKWFRIQATATRADTTDRVIELTDHPSFSVYTPNRVFALLGAFCWANPYCFHAIDGSGYDLLTDYVLKIDRHNAQASAQLVEAFSEIGRYDGTRQKLMLRNIKKIASDDRISVNVYEIVSRILTTFDSS